MEKSTYLALGAIVLGAGYASSASSATIFINPSLTNASFETSNNPTATPPGWTPSGSPGAGAYTVTSAQYTMPEKGKVGSAKRRIRARYSNHKESSVSCNMFARWEATKLRRISTCFLTRSNSPRTRPGGVRCVMSDRAKQNRGADGPMTLGDMRQLGVQRLIAYCLNPSCRRATLIDVSRYPAEVEVISLAHKVACHKCGARGQHIDVRPNWAEQPAQEA